MRSQMGQMTTGRLARNAVRCHLGRRLRPFSSTATLLRAGGNVKKSKTAKADMLYQLENFRPTNNLWKDLKQTQERGGILAWNPEKLIMDEEARNKLDDLRPKAVLKDGIDQLVRRFDIELEMEKDIKMLGNSTSLRYSLKEKELDIVLEHHANAQNEMDEAAMDLGTEFQEQTGLGTDDLTTFDAEFQEGTTSERRLEAGDLVEVRLHNMQAPCLAVIVTTKTDHRGTFYFALNTNGALLRANEGCIRFIAEKAFSSKLMMEKIVEWMDTVGPDVDGTAKESIRVPEDLCIALCGRLREYNVRVATDFKKITMGAKLLFQRYAQYGKFTKVSLKDAARVVYGHMSGYGGTSTAVRRLLTENPLLFRSETPANRLASTFYTRPIEEVELLESFPHQLRSIQRQMQRRESEPGYPEDATVIISITSPFERFIEKCQSLIDKARQLQKGYGQSSQPILPLAFKQYAFEGKFELDLIRLIQCVFSFGASQKNAAFNLIPWVLRETGRYDDVEQINLSTVRKFLIEIGMDTPWESPARRLGLFNGIEGPNNEEKLKQYDDDTRTDKENVLQKYNLQDSMKHFRKDWKDLPVYAIDSIDTVDVDDGISIEEVDENKAWLHVHIANPTAFIAKGHELADIAQQNFSKIYLPDRHIDMLPRFMNYTFFGLRPGGPALTFSGLYDINTGELLEQKIESSYVNNLKRIPYDVVDEKLGLVSQKKAGEQFVFGKIKPTVKSTDPAAYLEGAEDLSPIILEPSQEDLDNLRKLDKLTRAIHKRRVENGALSIRLQRAQISIDDGSNGSTFSQRPEEPHVPVLYSSIPNVTLVQPDAGATHSGAEIIAECMIQAGTIGAQYLKSRNAPAPYRTSYYSTLVESPKVESAWQSIMKMRDEEGYLPVEAMKHPNWRHMAAATVTTRPRPHRMMGLPCYLQVTSPLRRYADFIAHYQIEAHLREKHRLLGEDDIPFTEAALQPIVQNMLDAMSRHKYLTLINDGYWRLQGFLTGIWSKDERILGKKWRGRILKQSVSTLGEIDMVLVDWNIRVTLKASKEQILRLEDGDIVEGTVLPEHCDYMRVVLNYERTVPASERAS